MKIHAMKFTDYNEIRMIFDDMVHWLYMRFRIRKSFGYYRTGRSLLQDHLCISLQANY